MFRLHFTDAAMAQIQALGLDQDAVRTVIHQGAKLQGGENRLVCRLHLVEVEVDAVGQDYQVLAVRREAMWPRGRPTLPYLREAGGA